MADVMPTQIEAFRSAILSNEDALAIALALTEQDFDTAALGLMAEILPGARCRLIDPVVRQKGRGRAQEFHGALVQAMQLRLQQGTPPSQSYNSSTLDTSGLIPFPQAIFALVVHSASGPAPEGLPDRLACYIPDSDSSAQLVADLLRLGREARMLSAKDGQGRVTGSLMLLSDAAEDYGLASTRAGLDEVAGRMRFLARHIAGGREFWIDGARPAPSPSMLVLLDRFCQAAKVFSQRDFAWLDEGDRGGLLLTLDRADEAVPAEALAADLDPLQPFSLTTLTAMPDAEAASLLKRRIAEESHRLGYRVSLQPVPRGVAAGLDVGPLVEEIEDLKLQIAQIQALGAPQLRLLRFTDAQLPALVEALRRLPPERLKDGSLRYAAGHSAGRAEPVHYLLHDVTVVPVQVLEALWRDLDAARPMAYWLDPFVAEDRARDGSETLVFVPENTFLVPSLAHFGGAIDSTLRLVLGNLFVNIVGFLGQPGCRPMFLFTPVDQGTAHLEVELVDARNFEPLQQHLGWMNDYLQVRSPGLLDREALRLLAEELYQGAYVNAERTRLQATVEALAGEWQSATDQIRDEATDLITTHAAEIETASSQIAKAQVWLKEAAVKQRQLESLLRLAGAALRQSELEAGALEQLDARLIGARLHFEARVDNELSRSERGADSYKDRLQRLRRRIDALRQGYRE